MFKRIFECLECGNGATIYTTSKESIGFCSFCGETIIVDPAEFDEEEFDEDLDDQVLGDAWGRDE